MLRLNFHFHIERWKWNAEYQIYVSTDGRIKDAEKRIIEPKVVKKGYLAVKTASGLKNVHRIVMETFRGKKPSEEYTVDHIDSNKRNNSLKNLEYVTAEDNLKRGMDKSVCLDTDWINDFMDRNGITMEQLKFKLEYCQNNLFTNGVIKAKTAIEWVAIYKYNYPKEYVNLHLKDAEIADKVLNKAINDSKYLGFKLSKEHGLIIGRRYIG